VDVPVVVSRDGPAKRDPNWGLLVLTPEETTKPSDLFDFTTATGPTLVVLPKVGDRTRPAEFRLGEEQRPGQSRRSENPAGGSGRRHRFASHGGPARRRA